MARSCEQCGTLFGAGRVGNKLCGPCRYQKRKPDYQVRSRMNKIQYEKARFVNDQSKAWARHNGDEWTGADLEIIARDDLTRVEKSKLLGRTIAAVKMMEHKVKSGSDPTARRLTEGHPL